MKTGHGHRRVIRGAGEAVGGLKQTAHGRQRGGQGAVVVRVEGSR